MRRSGQIWEASAAPRVVNGGYHGGDDDADGGGVNDSDKGGDEDADGGGD